MSEIPKITLVFDDVIRSLGKYRTTFCYGIRGVITTLGSVGQTRRLEEPAGCRNLG